MSTVPKTISNGLRRVDDANRDALNLANRNAHGERVTTRMNYFQPGRFAFGSSRIHVNHDPHCRWKLGCELMNLKRTDQTDGGVGHSLGDLSEHQGLGVDRIAFEVFAPFA